MWIKLFIIGTLLAMTLASDESRSKKNEEARGKRNLEYSISHPSPYSTSYRLERRISNSSPLRYPQYMQGLRPYTYYRKTKPQQPPPYAVQMEPLVHYSQRDPLYDTNSLNILSQPPNELSKTDDLLTENNHLNENVFGPPKHYIERPVYIKEPEPIIEIIIKEANTTQAPPEPVQLPIQKKKKEEVQVFYVKYKKNPHGTGKDSVIYDKPIPAISPIKDEPVQEEPPHAEHEILPTYAPLTPPKTTTIRAIIKPDSETYHADNGIHITFGGSKHSPHAEKYSHDDDIVESAPQPALSHPEPHRFQIQQPKQFQNFPTEYKAEQHLPQPYRPFNFNQPPVPVQHQPQPQPQVQQQPPSQPHATFSQHQTFPRPHNFQPPPNFPSRPSPPQPFQSRPYQTFNQQAQQPPPFHFPKTQTHFPIHQQPPLLQQPVPFNQQHQSRPSFHQQEIPTHNPSQFNKPHSHASIQHSQPTPPNHHIHQHQENNYQSTYQQQQFAHQIPQPINHQQFSSHQQIPQTHQHIQQQHNFNQQSNYQQQNIHTHQAQSVHSAQHQTQNNVHLQHQTQHPPQSVNQSPNIHPQLSNYHQQQSHSQHSQHSQTFNNFPPNHSPEFHQPLIQPQVQHQTFNNAHQPVQLPPGGELIAALPKYEQHISIPAQNVQDHLSNAELSHQIKQQFRQIPSETKSPYSTSSFQHFSTPTPSPSSATRSAIIYQASTTRPSTKQIFYPTSPTTTTTTTTTTTPKPESTTTDLKALNIQLPDEVPDDLREQLLSSGILKNAHISVLDYDKVGDIPISALPPEHLANFYNAGGQQQISSGSESKPTIVKPDGTAVDQDQETEASEIDEVKAEQPVEMKVVHYDPQTQQGQQVQDLYVKEGATQVEPVVLNDQTYNRYLPIKVSGSQFPIPDLFELKGKNINSVVVLAPIEYNFTKSRYTRDAKLNDDLDLIKNDALKALIKEPSTENYEKFFEQENRTASDKQSVILLVAGSGKEREIFMYDVATQTVSKLDGELSSAFVDAAESNTSDDELSGAASNVIETKVPKPDGAFIDKSDVNVELDSAASELIESKVPIIDPMDTDLQAEGSEILERFVDVSGLDTNDDLQPVASENNHVLISSGYSKTEYQMPSN